MRHTVACHLRIGDVSVRHFQPHMELGISFHVEGEQNGSEDRSLRYAIIARNTI